MQSPYISNEERINLINENFYYMSIVIDNDIEKIKNYCLKNKFRSFLITNLDNSDILKIIETCFEKTPEFINSIKKLLNIAFLRSYNDILDYILDNYDFENFYLERYSITFYIRYYDLKFFNSYGIRKILRKYPDSLKNINNWAINCDLESAREIRCYGYANKLDPVYFIDNFPEFIEDCIYEFDIINFLNSEDLKNYKNTERGYSILKLQGIVSKNDLDS